MASSLKVSELNSLNQLTDNDLFLVSDVDTSTSRKVTFSTLKNNVTTQLAAVVAQNRQDAEALVEAVRSALQLAIDGNTSYSTETRSSLTSSDAELQTNIDNLRTYVDGKISSDMWLFSNQSEFPSAADNHGRVVHSHSDGAMFYAHGGQWIELTTKSYTDSADSVLDTRIAALETSVDNLDIDIAPETLNSINELAAAMGDDPTFLTTLQSRVTTIENDNATQTELDAYKAHIEDMNLQLALAYDTPLYVDTLFGG